MARFIESTKEINKAAQKQRKPKQQKPKQQKPKQNASANKPASNKPAAPKTGGSKNKAGGSQYSVKQDRQITSRQTQAPKNSSVNRNTRENTNRATQRYSTNVRNGSQYSVANSANRRATRNYKQQQNNRFESRKNELKDRNILKSTKTATNNDIRRMGGAQYKVDNSSREKFAKRVSNLTEGSVKQVVGGHLTSISHQNDRTGYDLEMERITDLYKKGRIDKTAYETEMKSLQEREKQGKKKSEVYESKARAIQDAGDKQVQEGMKGLSGISKIGAEAYNSLIGMGMDMTLGPASLVGMASRTYGNSLNSLNKLVKKGIISAEEAERYAAMQAGKEVTTEGAFRGVGIAAGYAGAGKVTEKLSLMFKRGIDKVTQRINNNVLKNVVSTGLKLGQGAAEEATEEAIAGLLDAPITNIAYANRLDKEYRSNLEESGTSINSQRDQMMKYGYTRDEATAIFVDEIGSDDYLNELAQQYIDDGMSEKRALKQAKNMQEYMIASLNGDEKTMQSLEDKMAEGIKAKFSLSDTLEAMAAAGLMTAVTGGIGSVNTMAKGEMYKNIYAKANGTENAAEAITKIAKGLSDKEMAARATAMYKHASQGKELSYEQYVELGQAIEKQAIENSSKAQSAIKVARNQAESEGFYVSATPQKVGGRYAFGHNAVETQFGSVIVPEGPTQQRSEEVRKTAYAVADQIEAETGIALDDKDALVEEITAAECGFASGDIVEYLTDAFPENRAVYEAITGVKLPADNAKMRDAVFTRAIEKNVEMAKAETIERIDLDTGNLDVQYANDFGGEGQQLFHVLTNNISARDKETSIRYRTAFREIYDAGRTGASLDAAMEYARDVHNLDKADVIEIFNAGIKDKDNKDIPTVTYNVSDPGKIKNSEREVFLAFSRAFGVNIVITDDFTVSDGQKVGGQESVEESNTQVNGMYYDNTIYLNLNDDIHKSVGYTIMHELTHNIEQGFPTEYKAFATLFKQRWIEKNGQESFDKVIKDRISTYDNAGAKLTEEDALSEIIADQMAEVLYDEEFISNIAEEHPSIARAILDSIRDIIRKIRQLFANYGGFRSEFNEATLSQLDMLKDAEALLMKAIQAAQDGRTQEILNEGNKYSFDDVFLNWVLDDYYEIVEDNASVPVRNAAQVLDIRSKEDLLDISEDDIRELRRTDDYETLGEICEILYTKEEIEAFKKDAEEDYDELNWIDVSDIEERFAEFKEFEEPAIRRVLNRPESQSYENNGKQVAFTSERIERLISAYSYGENRSSAYVTRIHPRDFLKLTLPDSAFNEWNDNVGGKVWGTDINTLDIEKLKNEKQTPYLTVDMDNRFVTGHEGRHRMRALLEAGFTSVPIVVECIDSNGYRMKDISDPMGNLEISSQSFSSHDGPVNDNYTTAISNLIPVNEMNKRNIEEAYGNSGADLRFSIDSEGNELSSQQAEYFKDSKVRDEDGNLLVMYHGTKADFTVFDKNYIGGTGRFEGAGFNFTSFEGRAMSYDTSGEGKVFRTYLNIKNPLSDSERTITKSKLKKIVSGIAQREDIEGYDSIIFAVTAPYGKNIDEDYNRSLADTVDYLWRSCKTDADIYSQISTLGTNDEVVIDEFEKEGFDGLIWHDDGTISTVIAFEPEQIKSVDNKQPTLNPDIRFSIPSETIEALDSDGVGITDGGTAVRYSLSSWLDSEQTQLLNNLVSAGYDRADAKKWINDVSSVASIIASDKVRLDYEADQDQKALKPNGEYYYTLDLSTLCQKRRLYQGTYNAIMHRLVNYALTPEDTIEIRAMMDELGFEVPCGICYEESRKKNEGIFAERWLNGYGKKWAGYKNMEHDDPYIPTLDEVTTTDGRTKLKKEHPEALESYLAYQRTRGSANPKVSFTHTDYRGDILELTENDIKKVKHIGGLRIQSFSDLEMVHIIDMMQAVVDMASRNLTAQAYTKVPAFADIFGGTGIKINLSLIGRYNEETGQLEFDAKEGIDPDEAFRIREKYSENVGTILVGADDISILKAWADDRIDMVIPFHRSGWKVKEFKKLGLNNYRDYTRWQSERYMNGKPNGQALSRASKDKGIPMNPIYSEDYWDYTKTGKENAEAYLKLCAEKKYIPVFSNFLVNNGDGSYSLQPDGSTDGYWKSLVDFKMYDNDGVGSPQQKVKPEFDMEAAQKHLDSYEGNADTLPVAEEVVDKFLEMYKEKHPGAKFSISSKEPLPPLAEVIPSKESVIKYSINNPWDTSWFDGMLDDEEVNTRGDKNKSIAEISAEFTNIVRDNAKLTGGKVLDRKSIKKQIGELVKMTTKDTTYTAKEKREIADFLMDTAEQIWSITGEKRPMKLKQEEIDRIINLLYDASDYVISNAKYINDTMLDEIIEFKKFFRGREVGVSAGARAELADDWDTIRKRNFGRVRFVSAEKNGVTNIADALIQTFPEAPEISLLYGREVEEALEIGDEATLVRILDDVLSNLSVVDDAIKSEYAEDFRVALSQDFARIVINEGEAWESKMDRFKDRYEQRIKDLRARQKEAIRDLRGKYEKLLAEQNATFKQKLAEAKAKEKERLQAEKDKQKAKEQKRKDSEQRKKIRSRIEEDYNWLAQRLVKPKKDDFKHVPSDFVESVANLLEIFDFQTERSLQLEEKRGYASGATEAMRELKDKISKYSSPDGGNVFVRNDALDALVDECIELLDGRALRELEDNELQKVSEMLRAVRHMVKTQNELFVANRKATVAEAGESIISESTKKIEKYGRRYDRTGISGKLSHLLNETMMTPGNFFDSLGGTMKALYKNLRNAQDDYIMKVKLLRDFYKDLLGGYYKKAKPGSAVEDWQTQTNEFTLSDGSRLNITVAQVMSLYCLSKREQALGHILGSGIVLSDVTMDKGVAKVIGGKIQNTASGCTMTYNDVMNVISSLTDEQKRIADAIQNLMNTTLKDWGNETSLRLFDMEFFTEENYFPISVEQSELATEIGKGTEIKGNRITSFGMTKPLTEHANNKIVIGDIFSIAADHCNKMALYSAYAPSLIDFNRVYNYKQRNEDGTTGYSVKGMLKDAYSNKALKFIDNILDDINGQAQPRTDGLTAMINTSLANYKKAAIGLNVRVLVQQPTAIMRSLYMINPKYFTPDCFVGLKSAREEMHEHCPISAWKAWGNYQNDYTKNFEDVMLNKDWSKFDAVTMGAYGWADDMTWAVIWNAVKKEVKQKNPDVEVGSEEYWNLCNERASEIYDETQVVDSVFHRSDAMRSPNGFAKLFTSFMAEPTRTYNMVRSSVVKAYRSHKDGDNKAAASELNKMLVVVVLNAAAISAAAAVVDAFRGKGDDDDEETWLETFYRNFGENFKDNVNMLHNIVFVKDVVSLFENAIDGKYFSPSNMVLEGWYKLAKGTAEYKKVLSGDKTFIEWISGDFGAGIGYVTGIPTATFIKDTKALWNRLSLPTFASDGVDEETPSLWDYENNPLEVTDGTWADNVLNFFGINLTPEERAERDFKRTLENVKNKTKNLSGAEKKEAVNKIVMEGYTSLVEDGDFAKLKQMRRIIEAAGGDVEAFDEKVTKRTASEYKKTIGVEADMAKQAEMRQYLLENGWTEAKISGEIVYKSNLAKDFKKACRELDIEKGTDVLTYLILAGITEADAYKLWENRNRGNFDTYSTGKYIAPTNGQITSGFGYRSSPTAGASSYHQGIDIAASRGSVVSAADGGRVVYAGYNGGYGNQIVIQHDDGTQTYYSHLDYISVRKGQSVSQKQYIGNVGSTGISTGPHLDFRVNVGGQFVDPLKYFSV